jgi:hypothetical protein
MKETFIDALDAHFHARARDIHTCLPGRIEKYNATTRKATVKVQVKFRTKKQTELDVPPISNVPVQFPGTKKFSFKYPLSKGDAGILLFSEEGIGAYLKSKVVVTADSLARFAMTDAIFIPGVWPFVDVPDAETASIVVDSSGNITINEGTKGVARLDDEVKSTNVEDATYWTWLIGFANVITTWIIVPADGGAALKAAMIAYIAANPVPTSLTGKITESSDTVIAGD